ncbi:MAG: Translation initiation factor IF-1 [Candidatus Woesebacteria bacterium GW2011_GWC1_43_10b]|uniref:Translation initiation factor IF-1 n=1 Tax=Candidatus Woesebacteria bacterium GW2011_GWC1_43_10b TaxID=1618585 RepID=A0A0G1C426_9BACT|nr:MAG: Translation initiation factor IF-1 [Candidatus Woesebacteria bacterium GW2011_GWC1_43_10b]
MTVEGIIVETLPGAAFRVKLDNDREILAYVAGKMRIKRIRILPGDRVKLELPDENSARGRITWRM